MRKGRALEPAPLAGRLGFAWRLRMRTLVLVASLSCALCVAAGGAFAQSSPPEGVPPDPATTGTAPGATAGARSRAAPPGGIYGRPGRCRELAISRKLSGLARQRFIKRCRIARRAMPRPIPSGPAPAPNLPAPGTIGPAPALVPAPAPAPAGAAKPPTRP